MRTFCGALLLSLMACATESTPPTITLPPDDTVDPVIYSVPGGGSAAALVFGEGSSFQFTGPTAPGSATFTAAPYDDNLEEDTPSFGGGSLNITLGGQLYAASNLHSLATTLADDAGEYLAISGYAESVNPAGLTHIDAVLVIIPRADFAPGATIALDGQDRIALFAAGNAESETAEIYGAAVTGTVQLSAGSAATIGGTITATVDGEFGPIEMLDPEPPTQGGTLTAGTYAFTVGSAVPVDVYCEGSLAGQEAAFANIAAASLGFIDGSVDISTGANVSIGGAPINAAFGASTLALDEVDAGIFASFVSQSGTGPLGSALVGKYILVDGTPTSTTDVQGFLGAAYETADGNCDVGFEATLTAL